MVGSLSKRTKVFISYSHADRSRLARLKIHLEPFVADGKIDYWVDTMLIPGEIWREKIEEAIQSAKVAILLVSADFLASKFIKENELPPLLAAAKEEQAIILLVILSPSAVNHTELQKYQAINPPSKPLSKMAWHGREEVWSEVAEQVIRALKA